MLVCQAYYELLLVKNVTQSRIIFVAISVRLVS